MKDIIKKIVYVILKLYEITFGNFLYALAKRYAMMHTRLMHYSDWFFNPIKPSSYKHEINLYNWIYDPSQSQFAEGGVLGRMLIKKNDNILDLCSGDGSYAYLFFSDIAKHIDAVDYDNNSIKYAKKKYAKKNIEYICSDLLEFNFKKNYYNVIIWKAGVAYFTKEERSRLFKKIFSSLKSDGKLYISTPLEDKVTFSANQIEVITSLKEFEKEFDNYFNINFNQQTFYENRTNINYVLEKK